VIFLNIMNNGDILGLESTSINVLEAFSFYKADWFKFISL